MYSLNRIWDLNFEWICEFSTWHCYSYILRRINPFQITTASMKIGISSKRLQNDQFSPKHFKFKSNDINAMCNRCYLPWRMFNRIENWMMISLKFHYTNLKLLWCNRISGNFNPDIPPFSMHGFSTLILMCVFPFECGNW